MHHRGVSLRVKREQWTASPPPAELMVGVEPGFAEKVRVDVRHMSN